MAGELQLLGKLISVALDILGISNAIKKATEQTAQEHAPYAIETIASNGTNTVINPTYGNSALRQLLLDVLTGIDVPNSTVVLPPTPPAGYGGGTSNAEEFTINSLYNFDNSYRGDDLNDAIESSHDHATMIAAQAGYLDSRNPFFALVGPTSTRARVGTRNHWGYNSYPAPDAIDWSDWNGTESLVTFLNRVETQYSWDAVSPDDISTPGVAWAHFYGYDDTHWRCLVYEWQLPLVSGRWLSLLGGGAATAPVWPGVANVTLGTPVSIANGASSAEDCDGVIVAITGVPADQGSYQFGTDHSYVHLGQLAFIDDNGEYEDGQNFGFAAGIITPRRMAHAAGFVMRVKSGVSGTVTPWVNA